MYSFKSWNLWIESKLLNRARWKSCSVILYGMKILFIKWLSSTALLPFYDMWSSEWIENIQKWNLFQNQKISSFLSSPPLHISLTATIKQKQVPMRIIQHTHTESEKGYTHSQDAPLIIPIKYSKNASLTIMYRWLHRKHIFLSICLEGGRRNDFRKGERISMFFGIHRVSLGWGNKH